jgi:hypothetical protein
MAAQGGVEMLVHLIKTSGPGSDAIHRQASKALANLGVNASNKQRISTAGGIGPLIELASVANTAVCVEAIAALANLAVDDGNEIEIAEKGGLVPILKGASSSDFDLMSQSARALRNLSVHHKNKDMIIQLDGVNVLRGLARDCNNERIRLQANRALSNLGVED